MNNFDPSFISLVCSEELHSDTQTLISLTLPKASPKLISEFDGGKAHLSDYSRFEYFQIKKEMTGKYTSKLVLISESSHKPVIEIYPEYYKNDSENEKNNKIPTTIYKEKTIRKGYELKVKFLENKRKIDFLIQ